MPFKVKYSDITTYKVDVIVNSLGVKGNVYGKLCKNIITKAKDQELKQYIDKQNNPVGTILVTSAGKLKANKIIHVVTPFKHMDNEKNELLVKAYKDCINKAIELGFTSIALPFIGTGANGYSEAEAFDAIGDACVDILLQEEKQNKDILNITVVGYLKPYNNYHETIEEQCDCLLKRHRMRDCCYEESIEGTHIPSHPLIDEFCELAETMYDVDIEDMLVPSFKYTRPFDFYDDFVMQKNIYEPNITKQGFERYYKHRLRNKDELKKIDIYRLSFLVGMNKAQIMQWMHIAGLSFSPLSPLDKLYWKYINGEYPKQTNFIMFSNFVYSQIGVIMTF